ncbi:MAG: hypothetical protein AAF349_17075 [Cyanobacteria bacterium P01_A01_bin.68]
MADSSTVKPIKISNALYLKRYEANTFELACNLRVWVKSKYLIFIDFVKLFKKLGNINPQIYKFS